MKIESLRAKLISQSKQSQITDRFEMTKENNINSNVNQSGWSGRSGHYSQSDADIIHELPSRRKPFETILPPTTATLTATKLTGVYFLFYFQYISLMD